MLFSLFLDLSPAKLQILRFPKPSSVTEPVSRPGTPPQSSFAEISLLVYWAAAPIIAYPLRRRAATATQARPSFDFAFQYLAAAEKECYFISITMRRRIRTTILLLDDDPAHLQLYAHALSSAGYRPVIAVIGLDGVSLPAHERPALVLLDYRFNSSLTVRQVAQLVRDQYPDSKFILLSSVPEVPTEIGGLADGFMQKGSPETLVTSVELWLTKRGES
jgi:CheY-like chemotaxis protein